MNSPWVLYVGAALVVVLSILGLVSAVLTGLKLLRRVQKPVSEPVACWFEKHRFPHFLNRLFPRGGESKLGRWVWGRHDIIFPRRCSVCLHYDFEHGQQSIGGQLVESEDEAANLIAQQHLMHDYVWDVDGEEVRVDLAELGACKVHDSYVLPGGSCGQFERSAGGALDPEPGGERDAAPEAGGLAGWNPARDPGAGDQEADAGGDRADRDGADV